MILLDTHVLVWMAADPGKLSRRARSAIRGAAKSGGLGIASISLWELAWLLTSGRLRCCGTVEGALREMMEETHVVVRGIDAAVAALAAHFPPSFPGDPADRLIAATAQIDAVPLVTADERIRKSELLIDTIW